MHVCIFFSQQHVLICLVVFSHTKHIILTKLHFVLLSHVKINKVNRFWNRFNFVPAKWARKEKRREGEFLTLPLHPFRKHWYLIYFCRCYTRCYLIGLKLKHHALYYSPLPRPSREWFVLWTRFTGGKKHRESKNRCESRIYSFSHLFLLSLCFLPPVNLVHNTNHSREGRGRGE